MKTTNKWKWFNRAVFSVWVYFFIPWPWVDVQGTPWGFLITTAFMAGQVIGNYEQKFCAKETK